MTEDKRSFTVFVEGGVAVRGYVKTHYVNEEAQEVSSPRDVEMTAEQIAAVNAADIAAVLG